MSDPRLEFRNPWLAAILGYLIPGLGHFYQGRVLKGAIYFVCITGIFFYGMALGDWQVVHVRRDPGNRTYGYYAQVLTGAVALPAIVQASRYTHLDNAPVTQINQPTDLDFLGEVQEGIERFPVEGQVHLEPAEGPFASVQGTFTGKREDGQAVTLHLASPSTRFHWESPVGARRRRTFKIDVVRGPDDRNPIGLLQGSTPRAFVDWFEAPIDDSLMQDLYRRLGKQYELALVYTWIAGLLNFLAVWDAFEGPAYGYGDEPDQHRKKKRKTGDDVPAGDGGPPGSPPEKLAAMGGGAQP